MDTYAIRVAEVQQELRERKEINVTHVFMTSDEQDEKWWDTVRESGWLRIDHEKENTMAVYGEWCVIISYQNTFPPFFSLFCFFLCTHESALCC